jgi:hypothetical protein
MGAMFVGRVRQGMVGSVGYRVCERTGGGAEGGEGRGECRGEEEGGRGQAGNSDDRGVIGEDVVMYWFD